MLHPAAVSTSHVREPLPRRVYTSRNWVALRNNPPEAKTVCGAEVTDRDLSISDVLRAGRLIRGGKDLDEWVGCHDCRSHIRGMVR